MSVLIKGGRIVTAGDDYVGDIFIEGESVSLIGRSLDVQADKVIDASGKYVIPGAVDPHTHMEMPFGGTVSCDDFTSGTVSAAFGGTTSLVDFCLQTPGQSLPDALATWHEKIERTKPVIDVGFHLAVTDLTDAKIPNGGPGIENRLHLLHHFGVGEGRISRTASWSSSRPTRRSSSGCTRARAP
jgi:dihydropyrimidinase